MENDLAKNGLVELVRHKGLLGQGIHMLAVLPWEFGLQTPWRIAEGEVMHRVGHIGEGGVDVPLFGLANLRNFGQSMKFLDS